MRRVLRVIVLAAAVAVGATACTAGSAPQAENPPAVEPTGTSASTPDPSTASPAQPATLQTTGLPGQAPKGAVLVQVALHQGPTTLRSFTPENRILYVTFSCLGSGRFALGTLFWVSPCDGASTTVAVRGQRGVSEHLAVHVDPGTSWRLLVTSGA